MIEYNDMIIFERDDELSEEAHFVKKLNCTLAALNLTEDSIMFIQAAFMGDQEQESNFDVQLLVDPTITEPFAKILKRGKPRIYQPAPVQPTISKQQTGIMDISDDEIEMVVAPVIGKRLAAERPISDEATKESKRLKID